MTPDATHATNPQFNARGDLLYPRLHDAVIFVGNKRRIQQLPAGWFALRWTPDGSSLVVRRFVGSGTEIGAIPLFGQRVQKLAYIPHLKVFQAQWG